MNQKWLGFSTFPAAWKWPLGHLKSSGGFRSCWKVSITSTVSLRCRVFLGAFIFTPKIGEDFHFDSYFSNGLKPPTSFFFPKTALMVNCGFVGLGPGGLDSWHFYYERDWDSWGYPDSNPKPAGPKPRINQEKTWFLLGYILAVSLDIQPYLLRSFVRYVFWGVQSYLLTRWFAKVLSLHSIIPMTDPWDHHIFTYTWMVDFLWFSRWWFQILFIFTPT